MTSSGNLIFHGWGKFTYRFFLKGFVCIIRDEPSMLFLAGYRTSGWIFGKTVGYPNPVEICTIIYEASPVEQGLPQRKDVCVMHTRGFNGVQLSVSTFPKFLHMTTHIDLH